MAKIYYLIYFLFYVQIAFSENQSELNLSPSAIDLGCIWQFQEITKTINITNSSFNTISLLEPRISCSCLIAESNYSSIVLKSEETRSLDICFIPSRPGTISASLLLNTDNPQSTQNFIHIRGDVKKTYKTTGAWTFLQQKDNVYGLLNDLPPIHSQNIRLSVQIESNRPNDPLFSNIVSHKDKIRIESKIFELADIHLLENNDENKMIRLQLVPHESLKPGIFQENINIYFFEKSPLKEELSFRVLDDVWTDKIGFSLGVLKEIQTKTVLLHFSPELNVWDNISIESIDPHQYRDAISISEVKKSSGSLQIEFRIDPSKITIQKNDDSFFHFNVKVRDKDKPSDESALIIFYGAILKTDDWDHARR